MTINKLNETAGGGSTGAGSVAVRTDGPGIDSKERQRLQTFLRKFQKRVTNRYKFAPVTPFPIRLGEAFDLQDVLSRLRGIEGKDVDSRENVTYGVEDDQGNIMKITVHKSHAEEFESVLAHELADIEAYNVTGQSGRDVSMAELLYNLKDKFEIVDVEFPQIPTDVVYNADKATYKPAGETTQPDVIDDFEDNDLPPPLDRNTKIDLNDVSDEDSGDEGGNMELDAEGDAEGVEDFIDGATSSEESILDRVLAMLKAQAEAEAAKANAEAEKYRAEQAEYSARAAQATVAQQEELARMEADMERQKQEEKQAKKLADIARYRVQKASSMGVTESDSGETVAMVRKLMSQLAQKWEVFPNDDMETRRYKSQQHANEMRELQQRMRSARAREIYMKQQREKGRQQDPNKQQNPNDAQNQRTQNNQQQPQQNQRANPPA